MSEKLTKLREKYAEASGEDIEDAEFNRVADLLFSSSGNRALPYSGHPTLCNAPARVLSGSDDDLTDLDVALVGIPTDVAVTNRTGARFGPRALRTIERIGPYDYVLKCVPVAESRIADIGDVPFRSRFDLNSCIEDIETYFHKLVDAGVRPLAAGGDHSVTYPILKALGREEPIGLIHIDAHCDTGGKFDGAKFHHGGPFRHAVLDGVLDPERTIQIGIRGSSEFLWEFSYDSGMTVIHAEEMTDMGIDAIVAKARAVVGDRPTYISFDIDALDPSVAPGTGTPEVGGIGAREAMAMLRGFDGLNIVGADLVEVAPQYDANTNTAQIGAQLMFQLLCLMVLNLKR